MNNELTSVVITLAIALILFASGVTFGFPSPEFTRLMSSPSPQIILGALSSLIGFCLCLRRATWRKAKVAADAVARRTIEPRPIDKDYELNRNEMTAWYQRLTQMYHFTLVAVAPLLGFTLSILKENSPAVVFAALFTLTTFVATAGMALIARTYSVIFRQGSYLRVFYETNLWIFSNRELWNYHMDKSPIRLRWVRGQNEPKYIVVVLSGLILAAALFLMLSLVQKDRWADLQNNPWTAGLGSIPIWLALCTFAVWVYRLWTIPDHGRMWEQEWRDWYDAEGWRHQPVAKKKSIIGLLENLVDKLF